MPVLRAKVELNVTAPAAPVKVPPVMEAAPEKVWELVPFVFNVPFDIVSLVQEKVPSPPVISNVPFEEIDKPVDAVEIVIVTPEPDLEIVDV